MGKAALLIYVVDDEIVIAQTLATVLIRAGFRTAAFDDPKVALSAFLAEHADVLISDVVMPGMTGIELAVRARQACPECKVLLLSGQIITSELLERASQEGHHFDVFAKPVHPNELLEKLKSLI